MPAPPALLDECLDVAVVLALQQRGFDVVSLLTIGPRGVDDSRVIERAMELGRVLITQNGDDFRALHATCLRHHGAHPGIICVPQRGPLSRRVLRAAMMLDWVGTQAYDTRIFIWGDLQKRLERGLRLADYSDEDVQLALARA